MAHQQPSKPRPLTEKEIARIMREKTAARRQANRISEMHGREFVARPIDRTFYEFPGKAIPSSPIIDAQTGRPAFEPVALLQLVKDEEALLNFFRGLEHHYLTAVTSGKLDAWKACANGVVELMCAASPHVHKSP